MKHILIALGIMAASKCKCPEHFNNPSLVSGYSYGFSHKPSRKDIKQAMKEAEKFQSLSYSPSACIRMDSIIRK